MKNDLLDILCCPGCGSDLKLLNVNRSGSDIKEGELQCEGCKNVFPIIRFSSSVRHFRELRKRFWISVESIPKNAA